MSFDRDGQCEHGWADKKHCMRSFWMASVGHLAGHNFLAVFKAQSNRPKKTKILSDLSYETYSLLHDRARKMRSTAHRTYTLSIGCLFVDHKRDFFIRLTSVDVAYVVQCVRVTFNACHSPVISMYEAERE